MYKLNLYLGLFWKTHVFDEFTVAKLGLKLLATVLKTNPVKLKFKSWTSRFGKFESKKHENITDFPLLDKFVVYSCEFSCILNEQLFIEIFF